MSLRPLLPPSPEGPHTYQSRFNAAASRELSRVQTDVRHLHEGRIAGVVAAAAAPTGGNYAQGDTVRNSNPTEQGAIGSKYVLVGWICVAAGNPGTWLEMRTLTGN